MSGKDFAVGTINQVSVGGQLSKTKVGNIIKLKINNKTDFAWVYEEVKNPKSWVLEIKPTGKKVVGFETPDDAIERANQVYINYEKDQQKEKKIKSRHILLEQIIKDFEEFEPELGNRYALRGTPRISNDGIAKDFINLNNTTGLKERFNNWAMQYSWFEKVRLDVYFEEKDRVDFHINIKHEEFGVGGTTDSSEDMSAPILGGTMGSSMRDGGNVEADKEYAKISHLDNKGSSIKSDVLRLTRYTKNAEAISRKVGVSVERVQQILKDETGAENRREVF